MRLIASIAALSFVALVARAENESDGVPTRLVRRGTSEVSSNLITDKCRLVEGAPLYSVPESLLNPPVTTVWRCVFKHDSKGSIAKTLHGLPKNFFENNEKTIRSGKSTLIITYNATESVASSHHDEYEIPLGATLELKGGITALTDDSGAMGEKKVLVVRIIDKTGDEPSLSAAQLSDDIFGTYSDKHNLKSQYEACSGGKLVLVPGKGNNVVDGVVDVPIPHTVKGQTFFTIEDWVLPEVLNVVGKAIDNWDLVMFVHPASVSHTYLGYAYYNWKVSHFRDAHVSELLVLMHEIGHNFGMYHSGQLSYGALSAYGDGTCMMGSHIYEDDAPQMCFNGAKSWFFGWYEDRHETIDIITGSWKGQLVGVDDYVKDKITDPDQFVVAKIIPSTKTSSSSPLYLMFNNKVGVNSEVTEFPNTVTVVQQRSRNSESILLDGLTPSSKAYRRRNWDDGTNDLVVQVCSRSSETPVSATVLVYIDDGNNNLDCSSPDTTSSSPAPTYEVKAPPLRPPTASPSKPPTPPPTPVPTLSPTKQQTLGPKPPPDNPYGNNTDGGGYVRPPPEAIESIVELVVSNFRDDSKETNKGRGSKKQKSHKLWHAKFERSAYRFRNMRVPPGAYVLSARLEMMSTNNTKLCKRPITGIVQGVATGNSVVPPSTLNYMKNVEKTDAFVEVANLPKWKKNSYNLIADVVPIVQEIVHRDDYSELNAMTLILSNNGSKGARAVLTYESGHPAKLIISYMSEVS